MTETKLNAVLLSGFLLTALAGCDEPTEPAAPEATEPAAEASAAATEPSAEEAPAAEEAPPADEAEEATLTATVGEPAPTFSLTDQAGSEHSLADLRGKIVVLEWMNPQCPYVQRHYEAGTMTGLDAGFPDDEVVWLAIDSSHFVEAADAQAWREENDMDYPVLLDASGEVGRRYGARTTPHMFVIDAQGVLRYSGAIDDDPRGRNDSPTNYVRAAVEALRNGTEIETSQTEPYGCSVKYQNS